MSKHKIVENYNCYIGFPRNAYDLDKEKCHDKDKPMKNNLKKIK